MFESRLGQSSTLKKILDAIKDLINQTNLDCSADGISLQAMDQAHVCLVTMTLRSQAFEVFRCDRPLSLGVSLSSFAKILKCAKNEDSVRISAEDRGGDCAEFVFENSTADRVAQFQLKLMDIDSENMDVPEDNEYQAILIMPSDEYRRIFTDLAIIGDTITISVTKNSATFSVEGDIGNGSLSLQQTNSSDTKEAVTITVNQPVKMTFPGKYLHMFTKSVPISDTVTLCIQEHNPLAVEFSLPEEHGFVRFFLAPKIDADEEDDEEGGAEGGGDDEEEEQE